MCLTNDNATLISKKPFPVICGRTFPRTLITNCSFNIEITSRSRNENKCVLRSVVFGTWRFSECAWGEGKVVIEFCRQTSWLSRRPTLCERGVGFYVSQHPWGSSDFTSRLQSATPPNRHPTALQPHLSAARKNLLKSQPDQKDSQSQGSRCTHLGLLTTDEHYGYLNTAIDLLPTKNAANLAEIFWGWCAPQGHPDLSACSTSTHSTWFPFPVERMNAEHHCLIWLIPELPVKCGPTERLWSEFL